MTEAAEITDVAQSLTRVRGEIAAACREAGRAADSVTLIAVSKTFGVESIEPVIAAGQRVFGENRVPEAKGKWPALRQRHPDIELHLIGSLQTNKVRDAVALFDCIHSLDRVSLASELRKEISRAGRAPRLFVQINTEADAFLQACRSEYGLTVEGLMCIPPFEEAPAPHFALTAKIAARNGLKQLSMGMSADFSTAIAFGATHVRVGTAIFGDRPAAQRKSPDAGLGG